VGGDGCSGVAYISATKFGNRDLHNYGRAGPARVVVHAIYKCYMWVL